jgi:hypothetical protein
LSCVDLKVAFGVIKEANKKTKNTSIRNI